MLKDLTKIQLVFCAILLGLCCPAYGAGRAALVTAVCCERGEAGDRAVISVKGEVSWKSAVLGAVPGSELYRLYIDIREAQPARKAQKSAPPRLELIRGVRMAARDTKTTRIVLELSAPLDGNVYTIYRSPDDTKLIVELSSRHGAAQAGQHRKKAAAPQLAAQPDSRPTGTAAAVAATKKPVLNGDDNEPCVIVIDPGHGGKDPGATGCKGIKEKHIALAIAKKLKKILEADSRCRVIMTRTTDTFVSLERRAQIANTSKADLFISIHANAHEDGSLSGTETYYLDFSSDADARRVAARENFTTPEDIGDLELILFDLLQSDKINQSSMLAGHVHSALIRSLRARYPSVRNLGVKHAPMKVLVDAEMPCLILETAFLSNPEEAKRLQNPEHQRLLAQAITDGISSFLRKTRSAASGRTSHAEL